MRARETVSVYNKVFVEVFTVIVRQLIGVVIEITAVVHELKSEIAPTLVHISIKSSTVFDVREDLST